MKARTSKIRMALGPNIPIEITTRWGMGYSATWRAQ